MNDISTELAEKIKEIIFDETGLESSEFHHETKLLTSGLVDSFTFVSILTMIEIDFGVKIPQNELTIENFDTIPKIIELFHKQIL